jgi:hypothetical protein
MAECRLVILGFHDVHDLVVVNQLAKAFEVTIEVLGSSKMVWSIDIADQDQSTRVEIMRPLSRRDDLFTYTAFVLFHRDIPGIARQP